MSSRYPVVVADLARRPNRECRQQALRGWLEQSVEALTEAAVERTHSAPA
jgi:hypothetical protein